MSLGARQLDRRGRSVIDRCMCCYILCIRYEDGKIFVTRRKALGVGGGGGEDRFLSSVYYNSHSDTQYHTRLLIPKRRQLNTLPGNHWLISKLQYIYIVCYNAHNKLSQAYLILVTRLEKPTYIILVLSSSYKAQFVVTYGLGRLYQCRGSSFCSDGKLHHTNICQKRRSSLCHSAYSRS